jgi:tellurite resistance protein TehA-like permease
VASVQLGSQAELILPEDYLGMEHAVFIAKIVSLLMGLWLWGLSCWFFLVSVGSLWKYIRPESKMSFQMTWWSFVFPNTALVTATEALGKALETPGLQLFGSIMAAGLVIVWILIFIAMLRCLKQKGLLWPKDAS